MHCVWVILYLSGIWTVTNGFLQPINRFGGCCWNVDIRQNNLKLLNSDGSYRLTLKSSKSNGDDEDELAKLYKVAMEEDEEWYNTFIRDILDSDSIKLESQTNSINNNNNKSTIEEESTKVTSSSLESSSQQMETSSSSSKEPPSQKPTFVSTETSNTHNVENDKSKEEYASEDILIQYRDWRGRSRRISFLRLKDLGYEDKQEIYELKADALDLILQDQITRPKGDILPESWLIDYDQPPEIKMLVKRRRKENLNDKPPVNNDEDKQNKSSDMPSKRQRPTNYSSATVDRNDRRMSRNDDDEYIQRRRRPKKSSSMPRRRNMERNYFENKRKKTEDEEDDSVWMDVSTFKQFLRKEMDLRLWILGPDWKDQIRSESQWRLNLYKQWISALEDGVGKDFTEEYARYPPEFNQKNNKKPKRNASTTTSRPKRNYDFDDNNDERNYYSQPKRRSRPMNKRSSFPDDFDQEENPYNNDETSGGRDADYDTMQGGENDNTAYQGSANESNSLNGRRNRRRRPSRDNLDYSN